SRASCLRTSFMVWVWGVGSGEWELSQVRCAGFFSDTPPPTPHPPLRNLFRRPLHQLLTLRQSAHDFDIQSVRDAGLDVDLLRRFRIATGHFHRRSFAAVGERDQALRDYEHVLLLADDD